MALCTMLGFFRAFVLILLLLGKGDSFSIRNHTPHPRSSMPAVELDNNTDQLQFKGAVSASFAKKNINRHDFLSLLVVGTIATISPQAARAEDKGGSSPQREQDEGMTMFKTNSGLKYLELQQGSGPSPQYGQLCAIQYTAYIKFPTESQPQKFDSNSFLIKHGNGRIIAGLDEGIHSMKVGGKRRLIIPPKLGYVQSGLGPLPEMPWNRWSLNNLLSKMVAQRGGNLVFEVELKSVIDDEADQGYYEDASPTPEEFEKLKLRFQGKNAAANTARDAIDNNVA